MKWWRQRWLAWLLTVAMALTGLVPAVTPVARAVGSSTIQGTVYGEAPNGSMVPLEGAVVFLDGPAPTVVSTAYDGSYSFSNLPAGDYTVKFRPPTVDAAVYIPLVQPVNGVDGTSTYTRNADLLRAHVAGRVFDGGGNPVPGAEARVFQDAGGKPGAPVGGVSPAVTDGVYGRFQLRLNGVTDNDYFLVITPPPDRPDLAEAAMSFAWSQSANHPIIVGDVTLPAATVAGTVYQPDGVTPVPGANVDVLIDPKQPPTAQTVTDGVYGRFRLVLAPGNYWLVARPAPGLALVSSQPVPVTVPQQPAQPVNVGIELRDPVVTGHVYAPDGTGGVAGVGVNIHDESGNFFNAMTDGNGDYLFGDIPAGTWTLDLNLGPDSPYVRPLPVTVTITGGPQVLPGVNVANPQITGTVFAPDGTTPVANAHVQIHNDNWTVANFAESGSDGSYKLGGLPNGTYTVEAMPPMGSPYSAAPAQSVTIDGTTLTVNLTLQQVKVSGRVYTPDGSAGVANVGVKLHDQYWSVFYNAMTDSQGNYGFGDIPPGNYFVEAFPGPGTPYTAPVPLPVTITGGLQVLPEIRLSLPQVSGMVYAPDGTPYANGHVQIHNSDWSVVRGAPAGPGGRFDIGGLPEGQYKINAEPGPQSPYTASAPATITVDASGVATPSSVALHLTRPAVVGQVYDSDGVTPLANAHVMLHTPDWAVQHHTQPTGSNGRFAFGGVAPASGSTDYVLEVMPPWNRSDLIRPNNPVTLTVYSDNSVAITGGDYQPVVLDGMDGVRIAFQQATKTIAGQVYRANGLGVAGAMVFAFQERGGGFAQAVTDTNGGYALQVSGGEWMIMVQPDKMAGPVDWVYPKPPKRVTFNPDMTLETKSAINFQVVDAGAGVTGRIIDPSGNPVQFAHVELRNSSGMGGGGETDAGGNFTVQVPAGTYQLMVFLPPDAQYGGPQPRTVTLSDGPAQNVGDIQLVARNSTISGKVTTDGTNGVASVRVNAWQPMGGGFAETTTQSDGAYTLKVTAGTWEVMVIPTPDASYVYNQPPQTVTVPAGGGRTGIDFQVQYADATIQGVVRDAPGGNVMDDLYGFAVANPTAGFGGFGAPLEGGRFQIKVPAGSYTVSGGLPPGVPYTLGGETVNNLASGETRVVELVVQANNRTISGYVYAGGQPVTDPNLHLEVFAFNNNGSLQHTLAEPDGQGRYRYSLSVTDGSWRIGYFTGADSGYLSKPPVDNAVTVSQADPDVTYDINLYQASATITGTVYQPDGNVLPHAFVWAEEVTGGASGGREAFHTGIPAGADGNFILRLPAGTYEVGAGLPPKDLADSQWVQPDSVVVTVNDGGTAGAALHFTTADAAISGTVSLSGAGKPALVWAWSDGGRFGEVVANDNGTYTLDVKSNDTWHVGAKYEDENGHYVASEQTVDVAGNVTLNLSLAAVTVQVPDAVAVTFAANQMQIIELANGTRIQIPAGALATSGNVTVKAKPLVGLKQKKNAKPVGIGYELSAMDANGTEITRFNSAVTITFPYDPAQLPPGTSEADLVPAYWDEPSGTWQPVGSVVVDTANNTITVQVEHFSTWGSVVTGSRHALTVSRSGAGGGTVTSNPAGIDCGSTCTWNFDEGTSVTLTATPASGSTFSGWSGACSGTGACTVTMNGTKSVTATFASGSGGSGSATGSGTGGATGGDEAAAGDTLLVDGTVDTGKDTTIKDKAGSIELTVPAGAIEAGAGAGVSISVTALGGAALQAVAIDKAPQGFRSLGAGYDFTAKVTQGGGTTTVGSFSKPVVVEIKLAEDVLKKASDPARIGLFRVEADGRLTFVGGKVTDGKLKVKMHGFSRYVLGEVNISFNDLAGHWAKDDVELMAAKYVARGLPGGGFAPAGAVTRAQFAAMLVRAMGLPAARASMTFSDVKATDWFFGELMTAVNAGVITGFADGTFRPDDPVTREQVAAMVARALKASGRVALTDAQAVQILAAFGDAGGVSGWARADLALAVREGIINGQTAARIAPQAGATRAEAVVMVARYWKK